MIQELQEIFKIKTIHGSNFRRRVLARQIAMYLMRANGDSRQDIADYFGKSLRLVDYAVEKISNDIQGNVTVDVQGVGSINIPEIIDRLSTGLISPHTERSMFVQDYLMDLQKKYGKVSVQLSRVGLVVMQGNVIKQIIRLPF